MKVGRDSLKDGGLVMRTVSELRFKISQKMALNAKNRPMTYFMLKGTSCSRWSTLQAKAQDIENLLIKSKNKGLCAQELVPCVCLDLKTCFIRYTAHYIHEYATTMQ